MGEEPSPSYKRRMLRFARLLDENMSLKSQLEGMMNLPEIVDKLLGPIHPIGQHEVDLDRIPNLEKACELTTHLIRKIRDVAECHESPADSVKRLGLKAHNFLNAVKDCLE